MKSSFSLTSWEEVGGPDQGPHSWREEAAAEPGRWGSDALVPAAGREEVKRLQLGVGGVGLTVLWWGQVEGGSPDSVEAGSGDTAVLSWSTYEVQRRSFVICGGTDGQLTSFWNQW